MVKRYEVSEKYIGTGEYVGQMVACSDGDYVEFSDYDALAARLAKVTRLLHQLGWTDDAIAREIATSDAIEQVTADSATAVQEIKP